MIDALDEALPDLKADLLGDIETIGSGVLHIMKTSRPFEGEYGSGLRVSCNFCHRQSLKIYYACYLCAEEVDVCQKCMDLGRRCPGHPSHTLVQPYREVFKDVNPAEDDIRLYVDWALNHEISQGMRNVKQHDPRLSYVNERTTYLGDICRENADSNLEERIRQSVVAKAQGMFVSAKLYMDSLKFKTSAEEIEETLKSPPNGIADLYNNAVLRINNFSLDNPNTNATDIGRKTLSLVAYAYRTLTLPELQDALAVDLKRPEFRMKRPYSRKVIFDSTAGLLDIHSDVGEVRLHLTAVEHFRRNRSRLFPNSATEIVQVLLQYLDRDELGRPCEGQQEFEEFRAREKKYHLMSYAYQHWGKHASEAETEPQVLASVLQYFGQPSRVDAAIQAACYLNPDDPARWDVRIGANALHLCAWFGLAGFMPELIEEQRLDVNSQDPTYGQTPLMYACRQGHTAAVGKLLDLGADVNLRSRRGKTAMFEAVVEDRADVATLLLKEDKLDITATHAFESGRTALMLASQRGFSAVVREILESDKSSFTINQKDSIGNTALILATESEHAEIVAMLSGFQDVEMNATNKTGNTALTLAARKGNLEIVEILVKSGANPKVKNKEHGESAVTWAVHNGNFEMLKVLLRSNVKLQDYGSDGGQTLLHNAAVCYSAGILEILIEKGLSKDAADDKGRTPLHHASRANELQCAKVLLDMHADPNLEDKAGRTPHIVAWQYGHTRMMRLFEHTNEHLPTCQCVDGIEFEDDEAERENLAAETYPRANYLPIWSLVKLSFRDLARAMIESTPNLINDRNPDDGTSALHYTIHPGQIEILEALLDAGGSPDARNEISRTALHNAIIFGNNAATKTLLSHGASTDPPDRWSFTPLYYIENYTSRYEAGLTLIEAGADLTKIPSQLIQPLFFVAVETNREMAVKILFENGADLWTRDVSGRTALEMAREKGFKEIESHLTNGKDFYNVDKMITEAQEQNENEGGVAVGQRRSELLLEKELDIEEEGLGEREDELTEDGIFDDETRSDLEQDAEDFVPPHILRRVETDIANRAAQGSSTLRQYADSDNEDGDDKTTEIEQRLQEVALT